MKRTTGMVCACSLTAGLAWAGGAASAPDVRSEMERTGLSGDRVACQSLLPGLRSTDDAIRYTAVRALGWCGSPEAIAPLIDLLADGGWDENIEAALYRIDPGWRSGVASKQAFCRVAERWRSRIWNAKPRAEGECGCAEKDDEEKDPLVAHPWLVPELLLQLDPDEGRRELAARLTLPAVDDDCLEISPSVLLRGDAVDAAILEITHQALAQAPAPECLKDIATLLDEAQPDWRQSPEAKAAADSYIDRLRKGEDEGSARILPALVLLGDDRARRLPLPEMLRPDRYDQDRLDLLRSLAKLDHKEAIAQLLACASQTTVVSVQECARFLGDLGRADLVDTYRAWLREPAPPRSDRGGDKEDADEATKTAQYAWEARHEAAVHGLAAALGLAALPEIAPLGIDLEQPDDVREAVVMVVAKMSVPEAAALLVEIAKTGTDDESSVASAARQALDERRHASTLSALWDDVMRVDKGDWDRRRLFLSALELGGAEALVRARELAAEDPLIAIFYLEATRQDALDTDLLLDTLHKTLDGRADDEASRYARDAAAQRLLMILADGPPLAREQLKDVERLANTSGGRAQTVARSVLWRSRLYAAPVPATRSAWPARRDRLGGE